jgi:hypothetical protein
MAENREKESHYAGTFHESQQEGHSVLEKPFVSLHFCE